MRSGEHLTSRAERTDDFDALQRVSVDITALEEKLRALADLQLDDEKISRLRREWERMDAMAGDLRRRLAVEAAPTQVPEAVAITSDTAAGLARPSVRRRPLSAAGRVTTILGVIVALFLAFEFYVSDLSEARSQRVLVTRFKESMKGGAFVASPPDAIGQAEPEVAPPSGPAVGDPVAYLEIPDLDVGKVVVEGTGVEQTKKGPGHLVGSAMPGEVGKVVIAGRRTTYGSPLADIDRLGSGDPIIATTPEGRFTYLVEEVKTIAPGEPDVMGPSPTDNLLVLVTSAPEYLASERLVAIARLSGDALALPDASPMMVDEEALGLAGDTRAVTLVLLWGQALVIAAIVTWLLYRRWSAWSTYLITTPVTVALLFLLFENLDRLLPATL